MEERKTPRNGLIDVMRLGFAGIVMMYHFYSSGKKHFPGGFLGIPDVFGMGEASSFGVAFRQTAAILAGLYEKAVYQVLLV